LRGFALGFFPFGCANVSDYPVSNPAYKVPDAKIRVAQIIDRMNVGGPAKYTAWLVSELKDPDFESVLMTGTLAAGEGDMMRFAVDRGVQPLVVKEMSRELTPRDLLVIFKLFLLLWKFKPNIIHTHKSKAGAVGRIAGGLYRCVAYLVRRSDAQCRIVHTYHGHIFHSYYGALKTKLFTSIERLLASTCTDAIVVVSEQQRCEIADTFKVGHKGQVCVVPYGIDLHEGENVNANFRERFGFAKDDVVVGIAGRLTEIKNHYMFIRAAAELCRRTAARVQFAIIGDGHLRQDLEKLVRELKIENRVVFTGFLDDMMSVYPELDLIALTSLNEGVPFTLMEAMHACVPVVATEVGGVVDLLGRRLVSNAGFSVYKNGVGVSSQDARVFAEAMKLVIETPSLRTELCTNAQEFVASHLSKNQFILNITNLYKRLLQPSTS
jgi:glycosyltransferase involved in cell wall biosynthesis